MTSPTALIAALDAELTAATNLYQPARAATTLASVRLLAAHARAFTPDAAYLCIGHSDQGEFMSLACSVLLDKDGRNIDADEDDDTPTWEQYLEDREDTGEIESVAWNLDDSDSTWGTYMVPLNEVASPSTLAPVVLDIERILADHETATRLRAHYEQNGWPVLEGVRVSTYVASGEDTLDDGAKVVHIDTDTNVGRVRINLNDGPAVWDGNPETGEPGDLDALIDAARAALDRLGDAMAHEPAAARALRSLREHTETLFTQRRLPELVVEMSGPDPETCGTFGHWDAQAEAALTEALAVFAASGGRGAGLAERIDHLRRSRDVAEGRCPGDRAHGEHEPDSDGACTGCGAGRKVLVCPGCGAKNPGIVDVDTAERWNEVEVDAEERALVSDYESGGDFSTLYLMAQCCNLPVDAPEGWTTD